MRKLLQIIRFPLDLVFVTVDAIRSIPDLILVKSEKPCRFCGSLEYLMDDQRPCRAADKYGNIKLFNTVCSCAKPADDNHPNGAYCDRFEPIHRPVKHLPLALLVLAVFWACIAFAAERYGHVSSHVASLRASFAEAESKRAKEAHHHEPTKREREQAAENIEAAKALSTEKPAEAKVLLDEAEGLDTEAPGLSQVRMRVNLDLWDLPQAEKDARQLLRKDDAQAAVHAVLAEIHARRGEEAESLAELAKLRSADDRTADHLQQASRLYGGLGKMEDAEACLTDALALDPDHLLTRLTEVSFLRSTDATAQARTRLAELTPMYTNDVRVLMQQPEFKLAAGDLPGAMEDQAALLERYPDYGPLAIRLANLRLLAKQAGASKTLAERCTKHADMGTRLAGHLLLGRLHLQRELYTDARIAVERALHIAPDSHDARMLLAQVRFAQREYASAIRTLEPMQRASKKGAEQRTILLARCYQGNGQTDEAIELLEKMIQDNPASQVPVIDLGNLHYQANQYGKAREIYERFLAKHPDNPFVQNNYIITLAEARQDLPKAVALGRRLYDAYPNNPIYADALGWSLTRSGAFEEAEAPLRFAVRGLSKHPEPRYHLATVLIETDRPREALAQLELALSLSDDFKGVEDARRLLSRLKEQP